MLFSLPYSSTSGSIWLHEFDRRENRVTDSLIVAAVGLALRSAIR